MVDCSYNNSRLAQIVGDAEHNDHSVSNYNLTKMIKPLEEVERAVITKAISLCDGNVPKAAAYLEVAPSTIYRKLKAWEKTLANKNVQD